MHRINHVSLVPCECIPKLKPSWSLSLSCSLFGYFFSSFLFHNQKTNKRSISFLSLFCVLRISFKTATLSCIQPFATFLAFLKQSWSKSIQIPASIIHSIHNMLFAHSLSHQELKEDKPSFKKQEKSLPFFFLNSTRKLSLLFFPEKTLFIFFQHHTSLSCQLVRRIRIRGEKKIWQRSERVSSVSSFLFSFFPFRQSRRHLQFSPVWLVCPLSFHKKIQFFKYYKREIPF